MERAPLTCPQTPAWISETWSRLWRVGAQPAGYRNPLRISPAEKYGENNIFGKKKLFFFKKTDLQNRTESQQVRGWSYTNVKQSHQKSVIML